MAEKNIRIGRVSSIDYGSGMISVTYPDLDDSVTDDLPVFSMGDEYKMPPVGAEVLVLHSTMFLLIWENGGKRVRCGKYFTFHNVSINT
ncbi:hypothetical protein [Blautia sp.]|uniref:hypothetical protein n=1 Tax=Blautia sp. TaxID=1955243 RepID=UPI003AB6D07D